MDYVSVREIARLQEVVEKGKREFRVSQNVCILGVRNPRYFVRGEEVSKVDAAYIKTAYDRNMLYFMDLRL